MFAEILGVYLGLQAVRQIIRAFRSSSPADAAAYGIGTVLPVILIVGVIAGW